MAKNFGDNSMREIDDTRHAGKANAHSDLLDKFIANGYDIESQDETEEQGLNGSIISKTQITILTPPNEDFDEIKLENTEVFGKYDSWNDTFEEFENSQFKLKAYKKNKSIGTQFGQWEQMDI